MALDADEGIGGCRPEVWHGLPGPIWDRRLRGTPTRAQGMGVALKLQGSVRMREFRVGLQEGEGWELFGIRGLVAGSRQAFSRSEDSRRRPCATWASRAVPFSLTTLRNCGPLANSSGNSSGADRETEVLFPKTRSRSSKRAV